MASSTSSTRTSITSPAGGRDVDYLFNELSFHGQFHSVQEFHSAVETVMGIRNEIKRFGAQLFCRREVTNAQVTADATMPQAINGLARDKRQAWVQWLTQQGPFWLDQREHSDDDWLELDDERIVTDTAIGEVAYRNLNGLLGELVTVDPSDWLRHPLRVRWVTGSSAERATDVTNHWTHESVIKSLEAAPPTYDSWASFEEHARRKCVLLTFAENAFSPLRGRPYVPGAAEGIESRLTVLNTLYGSFDSKGNRTAEGNRIYVDYFGHKKAWFTDSSDGEKSEFESELTFPFPGRPGEYLFCTWHGKVKTPQIRIHFSWPIAKDVPLYVVYVGPKITKR
jgi:hypothetical protein